MIVAYIILNNVFLRHQCPLVKMIKLGKLVGKFSWESELGSLVGKVSWES